MVDKIIKLLGGFTSWDLERVEIEAKNWVEIKEAEVIHLRERVREKDQEIIRLSNLIFMRAGFLVESSVQTNEERLAPINTRKSWPQKQKELEKEDARRYSDEVERRWKEKSGAVSTRDLENVPDES